jgi:hypothetical protein
MPVPRRGEVWVVDLGLAAKVQQRLGIGAWDSREVNIVDNAGIAGLIKQLDEGGAFCHASATADEEDHSSVGMRPDECKVVVTIAGDHDPVTGMGVPENFFVGSLLR